MTSGSPREQPARTAALTGLVGAGGGGGRRAFVDGTGTPVPLPAAIRRVVATDERVGALLRELGAPVVGLCGVAEVDGVVRVGAPRAPDPVAVADLRPDVVVTSAVDGVHDLAEPALLMALRRVAPVVAVDLTRPSVAAADLRALLGSVVVERPAPAAVPQRPPGPPSTRPQLW